MKQNQLYLGIMSGTSADGVDIAIIDSSDSTIKVVATHEYPLPQDLRQDILALSQPGNNEIDRLGVLDIKLGNLFAEAVNETLLQMKISSDEIIAIGSHGQTIRHRPTLDTPFTLQIGDPNTIALATNITTIADFRRKDMAAGGQGAPLAPSFHDFAFRSKERHRCIINIGGMANITWLPTHGNTMGFDTGPGNRLLDCWIERNKGLTYDKDGAWSQTGRTNENLLEKLKGYSYFGRPAPKSTGGEEFNIDWLLDHLKLTTPSLPAEDIQATLLQLTCESIADEVIKLTKESCDIYLCGGGTKNKQMVANLKLLLPKHSISTTSALGVDPNYVEAVTFAWLAKQTVKGFTGNLPEVTGANSEQILGGIYMSSKH